MTEPTAERIDKAIDTLTRLRNSPFTYRKDRAADRTTPLVMLIAKSKIPL